MKRLPKWLLVIAFAMMGAAIAFLILAKNTPWHTNSAAYFAERYAGGAKEYYRALHKYETNKWLYADAGYGLAGWSVALVAVAQLVKKHGWRSMVMTTSSAWRIVGLTLLACGLMCAGTVVGGHQLLYRGYGYDGSGGAAMSVAIADSLWLVGTPIFLAFTLAPLWRKPVGGLTLIPSKPIGRGLLVSLLCAPFLLVPGLLMWSAVNLAAGGWGFSIGAVLSVWLILNARALWMSERSSKTDGTPSLAAQESR
jgi:hypothetical protein